MTDDDFTTLKTRHDFIRQVGRSEHWERIIRAEGKGPAFYKFGREIRYRQVDIDAWIEARRTAAKKVT